MLIRSAWSFEASGMRGLVEKLEYATANDPGIAQRYTAPAPRLEVWNGREHFNPKP